MASSDFVRGRGFPTATSLKLPGPPARRCAPGAVGRGAPPRRCPSSVRSRRRCLPPMLAQHSESRPGCARRDYDGMDLPGRSPHGSSDDRSDVLPDRCRGGGRSWRAARVRGGLRPRRAEERRDDRHRRESGLRQLWAGGRLDRRPRPRRRAASLRLECLQQRAQARGPRHGRPRAPLPPGPRAAVVQRLRVRHSAGPTQPDTGQDDRREEPVRERRLLASAHPSLRTRRGLPYLPGRP